MPVGGAGSVGFQNVNACVSQLECDCSAGAMRFRSSIASYTTD